MIRRRWRGGWGGDKPLSDALAGLLERLSLTPATRGALAVVRWPQFVGPLAAAHARAVHVRRGVLTVSVDSGVWATELSAHIPVLLERISSAVGPGVVTNVKFVVGGRRAWSRRAGQAGENASGVASEPWSLSSDDPGERWPDQRDLASVSLTDEDREQLRKFTAAIGDPGLAEAAGRWLALTLKARRWLAKSAGRNRNGT